MTEDLKPISDFFCTIKLSLKKLTLHKKIKKMPDQTKTLSEEFAIFLKAKRMRLGLTQEQLAIKIWDDNSRNSYLAKIENGKVKVSVSTMELILEALGAWVEFIE